MIPTTTFCMSKPGRMTMKEIGQNGRSISVDDSEDLEDAMLMEHDSSDGDSSHSGQSLTFFSGTSSDTPRVDSVTNQRYKLKWLKLKRSIKAMIFENAALCDEVAQVQERILIAKEERRFLLKKFLSFQSQKDLPMAKHATSQMEMLPALPAPALSHSNADSTDSKAKKKPTLKKRATKEIVIPGDQKLKSKNIKRKKTSTEKRIIQPIPLDSSGRPMFPIILGNVTIHSLGEIVVDRKSFHSENHIFPVGFCSSRVYASIKDPIHHSLYTCTIMDMTGQPHFEIVPEEDPDHPLIGNSVDECHIQLVQKINMACGRNVLLSEGKGADFFGLTHPSVQNLIQSCPGARKCANYRWIKFEISRFAPPTNDVIQLIDSNPSISLAAFRVLLNIKMESNLVPSSSTMVSSSPALSGFSMLGSYKIKQEPLSPPPSSHLF